MAGLLDLLGNPFMLQQFKQMLPQMQDSVVSAKPQGKANMSIDTAMQRGMPGQQNQQYQDPTMWNMSGQPQMPDYSRMTAPGNPGGPSYQMQPQGAQGLMPQMPNTNKNMSGILAPYLKQADFVNARQSTLGGNPQPASGTLGQNVTQPAGPPLPASKQLQQWLKQNQKSGDPGPIRYPAMDL